ncbi:MAG: 1-acyl-sn-glycerol-3-phosphate acyltransferase [Myxococcota bacterium]
MAWIWVGLAVVAAVGLAWPLLAMAGHGVGMRARRALRRRVGVTTRQTLRRFRARIDRFKLTQKAQVRAALLQDPVLGKAVAEAAAHDEVDKDVGLDVDGAWERAELYLDEIVPSFNILSYFRVGYSVARVSLGGLYALDLDPADAERLRPLLADKNKSLLFLINHRSNADFVLLGWALAHRVALSYAVGEWARVWPLEPLFKSFGSYFVRRGERDPLYHAVLARYVQHIAQNGVTQGVFLEGGLSRDGALRPPKVGLLDSILLAKHDAAFRRELWIIPTGITYDRVLEDETLIQEAGGRKPEHWQRRKLLLRQARQVAGYLFGQGWKWLLERQRKFGHAALRIGEPMRVDDWLAAHPELTTLDRAARKPILEAYATQVMENIGRNMAVLPMGILACILQQRQALPEAEARVLFDEMAQDLRARGARLWQPHPRVRDPFKLARQMLVRRGVLKAVEGALVVTEGAREIVAYYARGLHMWMPEVLSPTRNAALPVPRDVEKVG